MRKVVSIAPLHFAQDCAGGYGSSGQLYVLIRERSRIPSAACVVICVPFPSIISAVVMTRKYIRQLLIWINSFMLYDVLLMIAVMIDASFSRNRLGILWFVSNKRPKSLKNFHVCFMVESVRSPPYLLYSSESTFSVAPLSSCNPLRQHNRACPT